MVLHISFIIIAHVYKCVHINNVNVTYNHTINSNKTNESKECDISYHRYFLDEVFRFQTYVLNGCHNLLMTSTNLDNIAIISINGCD